MSIYDPLFRDLIERKIKTKKWCEDHSIEDDIKFIAGAITQEDFVLAFGYDKDEYGNSATILNIRFDHDGDFIGATLHANYYGDGKPVHLPLEPKHQLLIIELMKDSISNRIYFYGS